MQLIMGAMRRAINDYDMIQPGDKIAVGLSGGKDSMVLLEALHHLRTYIGIPFEVMAITIDPRFNKQEGDYSAIQEFCKVREIQYIVHRSDLAEIIFDIRKESNPCSLCARMRRGMLHTIAKEQGCNKLALGHHRDDVVETFMMNLFQEARLGSFLPVTYLSRRDLTMIRPMVYICEKDIKRVVRKGEIPIVVSACPVDGHTKREEIKEWIHMMEREKTVPHFSEKVFGALTRSDLRGWSPKKQEDLE